MLRGNDWRKLLKEYAETAAREMGVKPFAADRNLTGYCTWYYYYDQVSEANLLENIDAIAARVQFSLSTTSWRGSKNLHEMRFRFTAGNGKIQTSRHGRIHDGISIVVS